MSLLGNDTVNQGEATVAAPVGATIYLRYRGFKAIVPIPLPVGRLVVYRPTTFEFVPEAEALAELANTQALALISEKQ
jgi:hypothetical protein